ncbi:MmgE/PrpD family protein [Aminobacter ciceronei]|uniref:2-methylcitrate dehydratase PrpD n=1 Tax=Aminobacter ciceronei TaxID=150723 RepID=A0ABR6CGG5_9HYPH|nr:MmgE/PrpD family protein [Aminobacter ciceronei]MBA8909926.1 2-methylcitrate dehydratase PrpD [Aminobacter ciceronei]MBA9023698.1 2-methylcitrate dehydratase PrpD [Aminobacter ciceronei]
MSQPKQQTHSFSALLAGFASELTFAAVPAAVIDRAQDLFVDWVGSALAGKGGRPVEIIANFCRSMGPADGPCEILIERRGTSALFAAMVNGAASHYVEQDDVHSGSVLHPGAVVFPAALAISQEIGSSGHDFLTACVAGYEVGIRVGEYLGRSHYKVFHTTGTAGTIAAAAATGRLLKLSPDQMLDAFGSAGTQAAGLWEFLRDAADSKPLHVAKAAGSGLTSAYLAKSGFTGAKRILEGPQGMAKGMSTDANPDKLVDGLGSRWALAETSFKIHASCRHTHPAADALLKAMRENDLSAGDIAEVTALVHQGAIDVLSAVVSPANVHQAKFSMGTTLGLIAVYGQAGLSEFEHGFRNQEVAEFQQCVRMALDAEVDQAYPVRWIGKVRLRTRDGRIIEVRVDAPRGDPVNALSRSEIEDKFRRLAAFSQATDTSETNTLLSRLWQVDRARQVSLLIPRNPSRRRSPNGPKPQA